MHTHQTFTKATTCVYACKGYNSSTTTDRPLFINFSLDNIALRISELRNADISWHLSARALSHNFIWVPTADATAVYIPMAIPL